MTSSKLNHNWTYYIWMCIVIAASAGFAFFATVHAFGQQSSPSSHQNFYGRVESYPTVNISPGIYVSEVEGPHNFLLEYATDRYSANCRVINGEHYCFSEGYIQYYSGQIENRYFKWFGDIKDALDFLDNHSDIQFVGLYQPSTIKVITKDEVQEQKTYKTIRKHLLESVVLTDEQIK